MPSPSGHSTKYDFLINLQNKQYIYWYPYFKTVETENYKGWITQWVGGDIWNGTQILQLEF